MVATASLTACLAGQYGPGILVQLGHVCTTDSTVLFMAELPAVSFTTISILPSDNWDLPDCRICARTEGLARILYLLIN